MENKIFQEFVELSLPSSSDTKFKEGDKVKVKDGDRFRSYILGPGRIWVASQSMLPDEQSRLTRLNTTQVSKLESLNTQAQIDAKIAQAIAGEKGSIGILDPAPTEDGVYRAKSEGTYPNLGGLVVEEGKSVWFLKSGSVWTIYSEIDAAPATGIVQQNNTGATSGNTVYNAITPVKDTVDSIATRKNLFNKENILLNTGMETMNATEVRMFFESGSAIGYALLPIGKTYTIQGIAINTTGRRSGFFITLDRLITSPRNNTATFNMPSGYVYFCFGVKYQTGEMVDLDLIQIEEGSVPTDVVPYNQLVLNLDGQFTGQVAPEEDIAPSGDTVYKAVQPTVIAVESTTVKKSVNIWDRTSILINRNIDVFNNGARIMEQEGSIIGYMPIEYLKTYYLVLGNLFNTAGHRAALVEDLETHTVYGTDNRLSSNPWKVQDQKYKYVVFGITYQPSGSTIPVEDIYLGEGSTAPSKFSLPNDYYQKADGNRGSYLTGQSHAHAANPWYGLAINRLRGNHYNGAVSDENITHTAFKMYNGTLYSPSEMESFQYFCIFQTHNYTVSDTVGIQEDYHDYEPIVVNGLTRSQAWDYVLKKYKDECYQLKDNPASIYYGTPYGKPCNIVVFTAWHDGRTVFNTSIRELRDKWGFNLLELDTQMGFSKNQLHPSTGEQVSRIYAVDNEVIDGVTYGWHPIRTADNPVQQRIANLFADFISKL